jgi:hypothetical protein
MGHAPTIARRCPPPRRILCVEGGAGAAQSSREYQPVPTSTGRPTPSMPCATCSRPSPSTSRTSKASPATSRSTPAPCRAGRSGVRTTTASVPVPSALGASLARRVDASLRERRPGAGGRVRSCGGGSSDSRSSSGWSVALAMTVSLRVRAPRRRRALRRRARRRRARQQIPRERRARALESARSRGACVGSRMSIARRSSRVAWAATSSARSRRLCTSHRTTSSPRSPSTPARSACWRRCATAVGGSWSSAGGSRSACPT